MEYILEGIRVTLITPNLSTTSHTAAHFNSRLWIYDKQTRCCYEIAKKFCRESNFSHGHWLVKKKKDEAQMQCIKPKCHWERRERELCFGRISIHSLPWAPWTMQIEVSRIPEDSTKLISSIGTDPSWSDWHLQRVGDGSQSSVPDLDGSSGGFRPKKPDLPNPPNKTSKRRRKSGDVWASQLLFGHVWPSVT